MLGNLSRSQLTDLETQLSSSSVRFEGSYIDPYRFTTNTNDKAKPTCEVFDATWKWDALEASTYVLWWAFRPSYCKNCGSVDSWKPSPDFEYVCPQCFTGAGTTNLQSDIVADNDMLQNTENYAARFGDSSDSDGGEGDHERDELHAGGAGGGSLLQNRTGDKNGLSSGNIYSSSSVASSAISCISLAQWTTDLLRKLRFLHLGIASQLDTTLFPAILKVIVNLMSVLYLPDMTNDCIEALKAACFYISCTVVIPSVVSFPSLQSIVADTTTYQTTTSTNSNNNSKNTNNNNNANNTSNNNNNPNNAASSSSSGGVIDLRWTDVLYVSNMVGVEMEDFFSGDSRQHTRNLVALMMDHQPTGKLYDTARSQRAHKILVEMKKRASEFDESRQGEKFSPDHTAAIFVLECGRQQPELVKEWKNSLSAPLPQQQQETTNTSSSSNPTSSYIADQQQQQHVLHPIIRRASSEISLLNNNNTHQGNASGEKNQNLWTLLVALSETLRMTPAAFTEMVEKSGYYGEKLNFYSSTLQQRLSIGEYLLPLTRRLSPCISPWNSVFRALHSDDRLPFLAALQVLSTASDATKRHSAALAVVQQILRKHGSLMTVCFNYLLYVNDPSFRSYNGLYFCTQIDRRGALYMSLSQSKSLRFMGSTHQVYLNEASERNSERLVASNIGCHTVDPLTVAIESQAAKLVIDCVQQSASQQNNHNQQTIHAWNDAAAKLSVCAQLRRKANACVVLEEENNHHHNHHQDQQDFNQIVANNRLKCPVLLDSNNIRGMLAAERKNPSWTTAVLSSNESLKNQVSTFSDPEKIEAELIERGIFPASSIVPSLFNNDNMIDNEQQQIISSLHHRVRCLGLARMNDLEALVLNTSFVGALTEYQQLHNISNINNNMVSPKVAPTGSNNNKEPNSSGGGGGGKKKNSASPVLNASAVANNNKEKDPGQGGKRRSRSPPSKASPKLQPLPPASVVSSSTSNNNKPSSTSSMILPPGSLLLFTTASKAKEELAKRI